LGQRDWSLAYSGHLGTFLVSFDGTEQFAADMFVSCLAVAEHAFGSAYDGNTQPCQWAGQFGDSGIDAPAGLALTLDPVDQLLALRAVLQLYAEYALSPVVDYSKAIDIAFVFEYGGDAGADLAVATVDALGVVPGRIADACEHVSD